MTAEKNHFPASDILPVPKASCPRQLKREKEENYVIQQFQLMSHWKASLCSKNVLKRRNRRLEKNLENQDLGESYSDGPAEAQDSRKIADISLSRSWLNLRL